MKLHSARGTWTVEGRPLYTIPPHRELSRDEMASLYQGVQFGSLTYRVLRSPCEFERLVVMKDTGRHVIVPLTPYVQMISDTEDT